MILRLEFIQCNGSIYVKIKRRSVTSPQQEGEVHSLFWNNTVINGTYNASLLQKLQESIKRERRDMQAN